MGLKRLIKERKQRANKVDKMIDDGLTNLSTSPSTKGVFSGRVVDKCCMGSDPSEEPTNQVPCIWPTCPSPNKDPFDCESCAFIRWVESANPGDSWKLGPEWISLAREVQEAADETARERNSQLRIWLTSEDQLVCQENLQLDEVSIPSAGIVESSLDPQDDSENPIKYLEQQIENAWKFRTPWSFDVPEGYEAKSLCRRIAHQFDTWWDDEPGTQLMGVMVLPAFPEQPERICLYRLSLGECHPPSVMDDSSMLLQKMTLWAEHCQTGAEWPIPAEWCEKADGLQRMADNVARATGRDRQIRLIEKCLRCVPWGYEK